MAIERADPRARGEALENRRPESGAPGGSPFGRLAGRSATRASLRGDLERLDDPGRCPAATDGRSRETWSPSRGRSSSRGAPVRPDVPGAVLGQVLPRPAICRWVPREPPCVTPGAMTTSSPHRSFGLHEPAEARASIDETGPSAGLGRADPERTSRVAGERANPASCGSPPRSRRWNGPVTPARRVAGSSPNEVKSPDVRPPAFGKLDLGELPASGNA